MQNSGSDYALACYQLLETAIAEAEVWEVSFANIGLEGFDTGQLPRVRLQDCLIFCQRPAVRNWPVAR